MNNSFLFITLPKQSYCTYLLPFIYLIPMNFGGFKDKFIPYFGNFNHI